MAPSVATAVTIFLVALLVPAHAAEPGISVIGAGSAKARPSQAEINAHITGEAEIAADATVKFRDARRRAVEAVEALKIQSLTIEPTGVAVTSAVNQAQVQAMMQGQMAANTKVNVQVSERLKLVIAGLDKLDPAQFTDTLVQLIDTLKDVGAVVGDRTPSNYLEFQMAVQRGGGVQAVVYRCTDTSEARGQAYRQAMRDARQKAQRLAELAGVILGPIVSVQETPAAARAPQQPFTPWGLLATPRAEGVDPTSNVLEEIPIEVVLAVQFAIER